MSMGGREIFSQPYGDIFYTAIFFYRQEQDFIDCI